MRSILPAAWPHLSQECEAFSLVPLIGNDLLDWTRSTARPPQKFIVIFSGHEAMIRPAKPERVSTSTGSPPLTTTTTTANTRTSNANLDITTIVHGPAAIAVPHAVYPYFCICICICRRCRVGSQQTGRRFSLQSALPLYQHQHQHQHQIRAPLHPRNHLLRWSVRRNVRAGMLAISALFRKGGADGGEGSGVEGRARGDETIHRLRCCWCC